LVIRCERCSTLYELDEALLSPSGSQVQCTRCQHVFTAHPPRSAGRTLVGVPAQAAAAGAAPPAAKAPSAGALQAEKPRALHGAGARPAATASGLPGRPEQRGVRPGSPPVYRPAAPTGGSPAPSAVRAPVLRKDTIGAFEARLRWSARWRWLAPSLVALAVAAAAAGWTLLSRRGDPAAGRERAEALALAALDDTASLERAMARLDELERRTPALPGVAADRALVQVLRAASLAEEGEALAARQAARGAERERQRREQPAGWEEAERAAAADAQALEAEVRAREERAQTLGAAALATLRGIPPGGSEAPEVTRALAAYHALAGERERVGAAAAAARGRAGDPWLDLARAWLDARDQDREARERALGALRVLSTSHPELLRGRYLLARTQAALGRRGEAIATLDGLLLANARHEGARRLREELSLPPALAPPPLVALPPAKAPAPRKPAPPPPRPGTEAAPVPGEAPQPVPAPAAPSAAPSAAPPAANVPPPPAAAEPGAGSGSPGEEPVRPPPRPRSRPEPDPFPPSNGG